MSKRPSAKSMTFAFVAALVVAAGPAWPQPAPSPAKRPSLTMSQRLERLASESAGPNPVLPVIMHSLERYVDGADDLSEIDRAVHDALEKHPGITREKVRSAVANWKGLPRTLRAKLAPADLLDLDPAKKVDLERFRGSLRSAAIASARTPNAAAASGVLRLGPDGRAITASRGTGGLALAGQWKRKPHLASFESEGGPSVIRPGHTLALRGRFPGATSAGEALKVRFYRLTMGGPRLAAAVSPTSVKETELEVKAPDFPISKTFDVEVRIADQATNRLRGKTSNAWDLTLPELNAVVPPRVYPGDGVTLSGAKFIPASQQRVRLESKDDPGVIFDLVARRTGPDRLELKVEQKVPPGPYRIAIGGLPGASTAGVISNWKDLEVRAPEYKLEFETIKCVEETNPKGYDDEMVTVWGVASDPNYTWVKRTRLYEDFRAEVLYHYDAGDRSVFTPNGSRQRVSDYLVVETALWEWDQGDAEHMKEVLDGIGDALAGVGAVIGGWAAVAGVVLNIVLDVVGFLVALFSGDPDIMGPFTLAWSAADLQLETAGSNATGGMLRYSKFGGTYEVTFKLTRHQP